jgi:uncharacterized membrane protein YhaH (DUF805 family)
MSKADKDYWFKRRRYGYGWTPVRWQGWVAVITCLVIIIASAFLFAALPYSNESLWLYLTTVITIVILLVIIGVIKGPAPRWRWGKKPSDDSKEDF